MPQIFRVYQIILDEDLAELINKEGWECHTKAMAYMSAIHTGHVKLGVENRCYSHVSSVVADDLEHVFEVCNIGPDDRITKHARCRSLRVGDIVANADGDYFAVANVGFTPLSPTLQKFMEYFDTLDRELSCA